MLFWEGRSCRAHQFLDCWYKKYSDVRPYAHMKQAVQYLYRRREWCAYSQQTSVKVLSEFQMCFRTHSERRVESVRPNSVHMFVAVYKSFLIILTVIVYKTCNFVRLEVLTGGGGWRCSYGLWLRVDLQVDTNVSEKHNVSPKQPQKSRQYMRFQLLTVDGWEA
jgi:hypothetical protein